MATLPNALRDIEFAISYLNGESMKDLSARTGLTPSRLPKIITNTVLRAKYAVKHINSGEDKHNILMLPPTGLRHHRDFVLNILRLYELEIKREDTKVLLDDPLIRLHLPARTYNLLKDKFFTVRSLIVYLNSTCGEIYLNGLSDSAKAVVLQVLEKNGLSKWFMFTPEVDISAVLEETLKFIKKPESFTSKDKMRLQETIQRKLDNYNGNRR